MTKDEIAQIRREVQENAARKRSCAKHHFVIASNLQQRVVCTRCAGEMDIMSAIHYRDGFIAAGGDRADVWTDI